MKISVVVSTYNSPEWLEKVVWGYERQDDRDFELVIADDGSGAPTRKLVEFLKARATFPIRHVWHEDDGFRKWRIVNRAILEAAGDYLLFTDGDCIPRREVIAAHRRFARAGHFLSGGYCKLPLGTSKAIGEADIASGRAFTLSWLLRHGYPPTLKWLKVAALPLGIDALLNSVSPAARTFNGNNSSCWKADALRVGGFDERIRYGGGDREFGYRLENAGVRPIVIRYSALCLHLDHVRGYKDAAIREANEAIISQTRLTGRVRTEFGIGSA
jgi:glycosyltransferase involved in cell wall biosynthesis